MWPPGPGRGGGPAEGSRRSRARSRTPSARHTPAPFHRPGSAPVPFPHAWPGSGAHGSGQRPDGREPAGTTKHGTVRRALGGCVPDSRCGTSPPRVRPGPGGFRGGSRPCAPTGQMTTRRPRPRMPLRRRGPVPDTATWVGSLQWNAGGWLAQGLRDAPGRPPLDGPSEDNRCRIPHLALSDRIPETRVRS